MNKLRAERIIGYTSLTILELIILGLVFPIASKPTEALETASDAVVITPSISLALSYQTDWAVQPGVDNGIGIASASLIVSVKGAEGYRVYVAGKDGKTSLASTDTSSSAQITSITTASTPTSFPANTWGYRLEQKAGATSGADKNSLVYAAIPTSASSAVFSQEIKANVVDYYELSFATKVDESLPSGAYSGGVVVSVVANPREVQNLMEAVYLQDFDGTRKADGTTETTSKICAQSTEGMTKQLIDARDGKEYWVAKLADGNCWMTQNLAYDLDKNKPLTPADSDVTAKWVPTNTIVNETLTMPSDATSYSSTYSWNLGQYVIVTPQKAEHCIGTGSNNILSVLTGQTLARCTNVQRVDESWTYAPTTEDILDDYEGLVAANITNKTYDSHYLIGNYYQWNTATAGTGVKYTTFTNVPVSICPKGWRLPTGGTPSEVGKLLASYGYPDAHNFDIALADVTRPDGPPVYLARNGMIGPESSSLARVGDEGIIWSSTSDASSTYAYGLNIQNTKIYANYGNYRIRGFSIRCLAR